MLAYSAPSDGSGKVAEEGRVGKRFESITDDVRAFVEAQHVFFVASAPLAGDGHVNLSPKGLDTLRVLGPKRVAYLDLTGSGNETAAHVAENGRLTLMVAAFEGKPRIVRLYCRARVVTRADASWDELAARFPAHPGARQIVDAEVELVQTSCGYAVPEMAFVAERDVLTTWALKRTDAQLADYRRTKNARSLDGLASPPLDR